MAYVSGSDSFAHSVILLCEEEVADDEEEEDPEIGIDMDPSHSGSATAGATVEQIQEQIKSFLPTQATDAEETRKERKKISTKVANIQGPPLEIMPIPVGEGGGEIQGDSTSEGKYTCTMCQAAFPKRQQLLIHTNVHFMNLEKPYRCDDCSLAFASRMLLDKHQTSEKHQSVVSLMQQMGASTSEDPRPYKCEECSIAFR